MNTQANCIPVEGFTHLTDASNCIDDLLAELQGYAWYPGLFEPGAGKMFGVLLCRSGDQVIYLKGFSGQLAGAREQPGFVPQVCDSLAVEGILQTAQAEIDALDARINDVHHQQLLQDKLSALATLEHNADAALSRLREELATNQLQRAVCRQQLTGYADALLALGHQSSDERKRLKQTRQQWQETLHDAQAEITSLQQVQTALEQSRAKVSRQAQLQVFKHYQLTAPDGSSAALESFFAGQLPPSGTGDCAAPKLLHYANTLGLKVLSLAEFWIGASPHDGVRRHGYVYAPCRGKCQPIMPFLLGDPGLPVCSVNCEALTVLFEDDVLAVLEKPAGVLSVPGKTISDSAYTQLQKRYPEAEGPLLVHRLDMDTSGILLMAKTASAHKHLQRQFIQRKVQKQYTAVLDGIVHADSGELNLPLRVDLDDRPRQLVCHQHGKPARTRFRVLQRLADRTRILFYPETGRTHQLRVHAAHVDCLNAPIVGDPLYGRANSRMHLHASHLAFSHPQSGKPVSFQSEVPF